MTPYLVSTLRRMKARTVCAACCARSCASKSCAKGKLRVKERARWKRERGGRGTHLFLREVADRVDADARALGPPDGLPEREGKDVRARRRELLLLRRVEAQLLVVVVVVGDGSGLRRDDGDGDGNEHAAGLDACVDERHHGRVDARRLFGRAGARAARLALALEVGGAARRRGEGRGGRERGGKCGRGERDGLEGELEEGARVQVQEDERGEEGGEGRLGGARGGTCSGGARVSGVLGEVSGTVLAQRERTTLAAQRAEVDVEGGTVDELVADADLGGPGDGREDGDVSCEGVVAGEPMAALRVGERERRGDGPKANWAEPSARERRPCERASGRRAVGARSVRSMAAAGRAWLEG